VLLISTSRDNSIQPSAGSGVRQSLMYGTDVFG
jgi:hypothetical protein